jgi:hypothetical protein
MYYNSIKNFFQLQENTEKGKMLENGKFVFPELNFFLFSCFSLFGQCICGLGECGMMLMRIFLEILVKMMKICNICNFL